MADRHYHVASLLIDDFQSFDALASAFNPAEVPLRFHKKGTRYFKASDLASFGKNEDKTKRTSKVLYIYIYIYTYINYIGSLCSDYSVVQCSIR